MDIHKLEWDSVFFKRKIFSVKCSSDSLSDIQDLKSQLVSLNADLAYIFISDPSVDINKYLLDIGSVLYDQKVTFKKELQKGMSPTGGSTSITQYSGPVNKKILELVFLAGHDSRFRKDPNLEPHFESLYTEWINNSIYKGFSDAVLVNKDHIDNINGIITTKVNNEIGNIGLIATDALSQGGGIGKALIQAVENYYNFINVKYSTVNTQLSNIQACGFYERVGYEKARIENVYHLWLKSNN